MLRTVNILEARGISAHQEYFHTQRSLREGFLFFLPETGIEVKLFAFTGGTSTASKKAATYTVEGALSVGNKGAVLLKKGTFLAETAFEKSSRLIDALNLEQMFFPRSFALE